MEKIKIWLAGGDPLPIKQGFPRRYKSRQFNNATCYHIEVSEDEYILFQNILVGPFSCWYTEYFFNSPKILHCNMVSDGVEFHSIIEGAAMYNMNHQQKWYMESEGVHNILVNTPYHTITALTVTPVKTFDIHVTADYFLSLIEDYPAFAKLLPALKSGKMGTLFSDKEQSALELRYQISQALQRFAQQTEYTQLDKTALMQDIQAIIASYANVDRSTSTGFKIQQAEIDTLIHIKNYIQTHFMDSQVIADAQLKYPISPEKLNKCFKILFNRKPKEFLVSERIRQAKIFMQNNPTASRQEIAMSVGYLDARHLNTLFIKFEGQNTEQYRAQLLQLSKR